MSYLESLIISVAMLAANTPVLAPFVSPRTSATREPLATELGSVEGEERTRTGVNWVVKTKRNSSLESKTP